MKPKVYTYYVQSPNLPDYTPLIDLWKHSWASQGWEPTLLNEDHARANPLYEKVKAHVSQLPTVNDLTYTVNDYLRWLALDAVGGGLATDSDVINYRFRPKSLKPGSLVFYEVDGGDPVPSMVYADKEGGQTIAEAILSYSADDAVDIGGKPHCSDMCCFFTKLKTKGINGKAVRLFGQRWWRWYACTHYANGAVTSYPGNEAMPKPEFVGFIQKMRPVKGFAKVQQSAA